MICRKLKYNGFTYVNCRRIDVKYIAYKYMDKCVAFVSELWLQLAIYARLFFKQQVLCFTNILSWLNRNKNILKILLQRATLNLQVRSRKKLFVQFFVCFCDNFMKSVLAPDFAATLHNNHFCHVSLIGRERFDLIWTKWLKLECAYLQTIRKSR